MAGEPEKQRIYEAIEACRPGSQDLSDPGLAFLDRALAEQPGLAARYEWVQAVDRQVALIFTEVPVPEGLETRILETLQTTHWVPTGYEEGLCPVKVACQQEVPSSDLTKGFGREPNRKEQLFWVGSEDGKNAESEKNGKCAQAADSIQTVEISPTQPLFASAKKKLFWWILVAGLAGAIAVGFLGLFWSPEPQPGLSLVEIQTEALRFAMSEPEEAFGSGQPWIGQPSQGPLAFSRAIWVPSHRTQPAEIRVRKVSGLLGRDGLAYDLRSAEGICATLYVVPLHQAGAVSVAEQLPGEPPRYDETVRTGGYCAAAWQENGCLYMLVVHGDSARAYYHFFRPQVVT
ncbi:MAG: hypothetical protein NZ602_15780 [Thermoguttaceae bacterium]|nr:hypothetical protein [Thermoguttaceae bacterium]MDW8038564.1 hypothetical protein [Thermoguttaceae bacterium]